MSAMIITEAMVTCRSLHGQTIVYCRLDGQQYVIAKSVVKVLTETTYLCGENPYIQKILERLPDDTVMLPVAGRELLGKVWEDPGEQKDVYFVKVTALLDQLGNIFPQASPDLLESARETMMQHLQMLH